MPGQNPTFVNGGPITCEATTAVTGGQVVEASGVATASGRPGIRPAAADSVAVYGVAFKDAIPASAQAGYTSGTVPYPSAYPTTDVSVPDEFTAVYGNGEVIYVTFSTTVAERAPVKAAAAGAVTAFVDGTDAQNRRIGYCMEPGGVTAGNKGRIRIRPV